MQRNTQQRDAIRTALEQAGRPLSPQELLVAARARVPELGLATVYRTIKALVQENHLVPVDVPGEPARYEAAGKAHHHHFLCRSCDRLFELKGCPGNLNQLAPGGYEVERHELTLFGRCADCRPSPARRRKSVRR
jgi:Fur family ferric uptake transcriptional regulator